MKKSNLSKVFIVLLFTFSFFGCKKSAEESNASSSFIESKTNEEWKAFCETS